MSLNGPRKPLRRTTGVKARNHTRRNREWERAYHSAERVSFVQSLPCCVCGRIPSENAHTVTGGMGRKADYQTIAPLCSRDHNLLHHVGVRSFSEAFGVDLPAVAARVEAAWLAYQEAA